MKITGTLINYYFHCKRQCYLFGNRLNLEDNSEIVKIGKAIHEAKDISDNTEIAIDNIRFYPKDQYMSGRLLVKQVEAYTNNRLDIAKAIVKGIADNIYEVLYHYYKHEKNKLGKF